MSSLPEYYVSAMNLPFNRACLDDQLVLQSPHEDPGGSGFGVLLHGKKMLAVREADHLNLPYGEWADQPVLYLGRWQGQPCRLVDLSGASGFPQNLEVFGLLDEKPQLPIELLSLGGMGSMILHWLALHNCTFY